MVTKISQAFEVLFDAKDCDLKPIQVHAAIERRDVRGGRIVIHPNGVVINSAVAQGDAGIQGVAAFGGIFNFPGVVDAGQEGVEFNHVLEVGVISGFFEVGVGQGVGRDFGPSVFDTHGPAVAEMVLVTDGGGFGGKERVADIAEIGFKFLLKSVCYVVHQHIGVVGP